MRILVIADLHYNLHQFDWLVDSAGHFDLVVIAGDLLDIAGHCDLDTQIVVVMKYLRKISERTRLVVSSGNHDGDTRNAADEFIADWLEEARFDGIHVDGDRVDLDDGRTVSVCPWWDGPVSRAEMVAKLEAHQRDRGETWIWIHHAPPSGSPVSWTGKKDAGDETLRELIGAHEPDYVIAGHIHNSPFRDGGSWHDRIGKTWVFNPGRQIGAIPTAIFLDLEAGTARWESLAGVEEVDLVAPPEAP